MILSNLKKVGGNLLIIDNNEDIEKLSLLNLEEIGIDLSIEKNNIKEINLQNLKKVNDIFIDFNKNLKNINLDNLIEIKSLLIVDNNNLETIELNNLKKALFKIQIEDNNLLFNISFEKLNEVGAIHIESNPSLLDLEDIFSELKIVNDEFKNNSIKISGSPDNNLNIEGTAFKNLKEVNRSVKIQNLTSISKNYLDDLFNNVVVKDGTVTIESN